MDVFDPPSGGMLRLAAVSQPQPCNRPKPLTRETHKTDARHSSTTTTETSATHLNMHNTA